MQVPDGPRLPSAIQALYLIAQPIKFLESCAQKYGDTFTLRLLGRHSPPVVFFSRPQAINCICAANAETFEWGKLTYVFGPLTGKHSLIMLDEARHLHLRQLLMPPLNGKRLQTYGQLIVEITKATISAWTEGSTLPIRSWMSQISLDVILQVVFGLQPGIRCHQLKQHIEPFLESVCSPLNSVQFFLPFLQQDWGQKSPWGKFLRQRQQIDDLIYAEITARRYASQGEDILSVLMSARNLDGQLLTNVQLRDQLITLLLLGHETTASALAWAFYWIHRYPAVLTRLRQELDTLGSHPDPMAITQLPYLNAICQETLRIYPIALISQPRLLQETLQLEGSQFKAGTVLVPCIYLAHHRPEVFPDPHQFKPERFLEQKFSPYEYLPFGSGNRSCIGMGLSIFEMKLVIVTILARYRLALCETSVHPVRRGITIVPSVGPQMRITQRRSQPALIA